jgi:hypothetical protein
VNWKHRIQGETDDKYNYRQEGDAPSIVFSVLQHEKQRRDLVLAPAAPAAPVATSDATSLVIAENDNTELDNYVDDEGREREGDKMMEESSEVFLLTSRYIGQLLVALVVALVVGVIRYPSANATLSLCCFQEMKFFLPLLGLLS